MTEKITEITIFVSCPDELKPERDLVQTICEDLTAGFGTTLNIRLKTINFRQGIVPVISGDGAQASSLAQRRRNDGRFLSQIGIKPP
ncbi:MAG: hypothetical protein V3R32_03270, partial [Nitrosomonadaceae bacterium]